MGGVTFRALFCIGSTLLTRLTLVVPFEVEIVRANLFLAESTRHAKVSYAAPNKAPKLVRQIGVKSYACELRNPYGSLCRLLARKSV